MHEFTYWINNKIEESCTPDVKMPERGDIVIKRPSAIFWDSRKPKSSWVKCPSNRSLDNTSITMYIIVGDQDFSKDGKFPALNTSRAASRSRNKVYIDADNLFDVTDIYKPEDRKSRTIWVLIPPSSKYLDIYKQWQQECQEDPIQENAHYKNMWKMDLNESKVYRKYSTE